MSERHPLADVHIEIAACTDIELFALTSLYQERIRRAMEVLEDLSIEADRRQINLEGKDA